MLTTVWFGGETGDSKAKDHDAACQECLKQCELDNVKGSACCTKSAVH